MRTDRVREERELARSLVAKIMNYWATRGITLRHEDIWVERQSIAKSADPENTVPIFAIRSTMVSGLPAGYKRAGIKALSRQDEGAD